MENLKEENQRFERKNMKKKSLSYIIIAIIMFLIFDLNNHTFAEINNPYEYGDNLEIYTLEELDSEEIKQIYDIDNTTVPDKFSLKNIIDIPVGNQQNLGLCMLFAMVKSVETNYALQSGEYIDVSERQLDYLTSKDFYFNRELGKLPMPNDSGQAAQGDPVWDRELTVILETFGVTTEEEIPYKNYSKAEYSKIRNAVPKLRVKRMISFPTILDGYNNFTDDYNDKQKLMNIMKIHVMKYGSITSGVQSPKGDSYNSSTYALYDKEPRTDINGFGATGEEHGVSIIGWDDNYSKDNFSTKPEHDGAFICLNSWGENWGENGYFYVSYDHYYLLNCLVGVLEVEANKKYNKYSYGDNLYSASEGKMLEDDNRFFGIKFNKQSDVEYFNHVTIGAIGEKVKVYINPEDDSFDKEKLIFLKEVEGSYVRNDTY